MGERAWPLKIVLCSLLILLFFGIRPRNLEATSLSLGADYFTRAVNITERDNTIPGSHYYDQRLQAYLTSDLSQDVEATIRIQSITPWGLETSTTPLATRYPSANGTPWVQNAFVRLPNIWRDRIIVTVGRQPIQWQEGLILSDDDLGFNAIRAQLKSPWPEVNFDIDAFTARITEGLKSQGNTDLNGALLGYTYNYVRWEFMGLWEKSGTPQNYEAGAETTSVIASHIDRRIYGVHAQTILKDAYLKGAYFIQDGSVKRFPAGQNLKLAGSAYMLGLGAKANTRRIGRFGAVGEVISSDGDDPNTAAKDEAFRPDFGSRWSGLERKGYGKYFAASMSDVYSPNNPFAPASSTNTGLPGGTSGLFTIHLGAESTPFAKWTFTVDYYQYKAQRNLEGPRDLGTEFDYGFVFRYSGLVNIRGSFAKFSPGDAFQPPPGVDIDTRTQGIFTDLEIDLKF